MNLKLFSYNLLFACFFLTLLGCNATRTESVDIPTNEIYMRVKIEGHTDGSASIEVNMSEDHILGLPIELTSGASITATYEGEQITLRRNSDILEIDYEGYFADGGNPGLYTIVLNRVDGTSESMEISMVENFSLTSPVEQSIYLEHSEVPMEWSPTSFDEMEVHGYLLCNTFDADEPERDTDSENETDSIADLGHHDYDVEDLVNSLRFEIFLENDILDITKPCSFSLDLTRYRQTTLAQTFAPLSYIRSFHQREVDNMKVILSPLPL